MLFSFFKLVEEKNKNTYNMNQELESKIAEKDNIDAIAKQNKEISSIQSGINSHIVDPASINVFVDYLESLGEKNNTTLKVKSVEISKELKNNIFGKLSIEGYFDNVMQTFALFENSPYFLHVTNMYLNKDQNYSSTDASTLPNKWILDVSFNVVSI